MFIIKIANGIVATAVRLLKWRSKAADSAGKSYIKSGDTLMRAASGLYDRAAQKVWTSLALSKEAEKWETK